MRLPRNRMKVLWITTLLVFLSMGFLARAASRTFEVRGLVLQADAQKETLAVSEEAIPGYMEAMTMEYRVARPNRLGELKPGNTIQFTLTVDDSQTSVSNIRVVAFNSIEREPLEAKSLAVVDQALNGVAGPRAIDVGDRVPDFALVDQTGARTTLSEFAGKVVAITFVYTRCPLPDYCLRLTNNFGRLQTRFRDRLGTDLVLLSITFDPVHDTPAVLAEYAQTWKPDHQSWRFLTGSTEDVKWVCRSFGINFWQDEGTVTHSLHTYVIDRSGKLVANIEGNKFTAEQLGDLVQRYF